MAPSDSHELAARTAYDAGAGRYVEWLGSEIGEATEMALDQAILGAWADLVPAGVVADVGCGPGRVAALLAGRGIEVVGLDVSSAMLRAALAAHPKVPFAQGTLARLPLAGRSLAGLVAWYSIIHTPPALLDVLWGEFARVVRPNGQLLLGFQAGRGDEVHHTTAFGGAPLTSYRHAVTDVEHGLAARGWHVHARVVREPALPHETTPQAFVLADLGD